MIDRAVVWDYDGTLVDTQRKNWRVSRAMIPAVSGRPPEAFPALASPESFRAADRRSANWRVLYGRELGLNDSQVEEAGRLWTRYQLADQTPITFFEGVASTLQELAGLPQAIFSQNSRAAIQRSLEAAGLDGYFKLVIGYEEVGRDKQKPAPDGLLACIEGLGLAAGTVFFVGDHDTDVTCARRADQVLAQNGAAVNVIAVGAAFDRQDQVTWAREPDYVARRPHEVVRMVNGEW